VDSCHRIPAGADDVAQGTAYWAIWELVRRLHQAGVPVSYKIYEDVPTFFISGGTLWIRRAKPSTTRAPH